MKVSIDRHAIEARIQGAIQQSIALLCEEVKNDCNQYCKWDNGDLNRSADTHSRPQDGLIIWQTPYARRQYWEIPTAYKDHNPNARWKWAEYAKTKHKEQWAQQEQLFFERCMK